MRKKSSAASSLETTLATANRPNRAALRRAIRQPQGRTKKTPSNLSLSDQRTLSTVMNVASRVVPVRENGEVKYMNMMEVNALFAKSAKGDSRALATLLALMQKGDVARALHIKEQNVF
jgi:hypothetical protein